MSLISSLNQPPSGQAKVAAQPKGSVQKPATPSDSANDKASKADDSFDKLLKNEQPKTEKTSREQADSKVEQNKTPSDDQKTSADASAENKPDKPESSEDASSSEESKNEVAELSNMLEAQANWKPESGSHSPAPAESTQQNNPENVAVQAVIKNVVAEEVEETATKGAADQNANALTGKPAQPTTTANQSSLLAQKAAQDADNPEKFKQDSLSEHSDIEDALHPPLKSDSKGTKTSLDIQQLVTRLSTPQSQPVSDSTQTAYSQVAVTAQNPQAIASAQGGTQAAATQAGPEAQQSLSMFTDPEWPEDLGQRLFRMSQGENGIKEISLRLDPPSLGTLDIRLKIDDNSLSVHFQSSSPQVRELLQNQAERLRTNLGEANMNLVDVDVSSGQEQKGQHAAEQSDMWHSGGLAHSGSDSASETSDNFAEQDSQPGSVSSDLFFSTYA